ncbi:MAG TPA: AMP-binding protein, partial [Rhodanobacteraceae bacterium]|nr:AMP-binding protein [Rhodanobacteraceae bacterium]
ALAGERLLSDPEGMMQLLRERGVTMLQTTPSLLRLLLDGGRIEGVHGLKLLVGGEPLPRDLAEAVLPRCRELWNLYGPTETTIWSTASRVEHGKGPLPLGTPIANTQIYVLDARGEPVPPGVTGEIWIGGAGVADGYQGQPELTAERFLPNPFVVERSIAGPHARMYRTGDMGALREGVLHFFGRADDQIKLRGYRIEPGDIEAVALAVPGVREAAAVAREFSASDKRLVLYIAGNTKAVKLRERLRARLPTYMLPQHIELLDVLPKTPNGKIDRKALPMPSGIAGFTAAVESEPEPPRGHLERVFMQLWRDLLRVQDIRTDDNFFDLGGDSLLAVRVFQRAQELTGVNLPLSTLLTSPTIAGQVAAFRAAGAVEPEGSVREAVTATADPWALLVPLQPHGALPPLFCIHAVGGNVLDYKPLARALGEERPCYGIQALGLDGITPPLRSLPEMAARYCEEIRSLQPHGPYFLAGRSMGGMIAYEMARQLLEQDEPIALLALFDTYGPGNHHFELQRARSWQKMGRRWRGRWQRLRNSDLRRFRQWIGDYTYWRGLGLGDAVRLRWARAIGRALPHAPRYRLLWRCHQHAYYNYVPPAYPGKITLFRAAEHPPEMAASYALGWENAGVDLEVIQMAGDHDSLIEQASLIPVFRAALARAQAAIEPDAPPPLYDSRQSYLAGIWRDLIGVPQVGAEDNFFELGGHSLLAVEMAARVQRETGIHLNLFKIATDTLGMLATELPEPTGQPEAGASAWRRMQIALGLAHAG